MSMRSRASHFLVLLCFWMAVMMAIGAVTVAAADSNYCESPDPPSPRPPRKLFAGMPGGRCPPP
ncbi:hypothetical protein HU200_040652 [Digitaria exilis]|uniref:Uncharacterized protein n=1 Tax=Digitaria exilis TaxID=1010633 RepID=A0A835B9H8_9POAL|nr:hypothetical protein HU200_040652 [Digitaria exilis]